MKAHPAYAELRDAPITSCDDCSRLGVLLGAAVTDCPHTRTDELIEALGEALEASDPPRRRDALLTRLGASTLVLALTGVLAGYGTWAAFSDTTENAPNLFEAGTVEISDNDSGDAMFELNDLAPGDSATRCIAVIYTGSLPASVVMYGETSGDLAQYLDVTVERGTGGGAFPTCSGFSATTTVYSGALSSWPATYGTGLSEPVTWNQSDTWVYRFTVTLRMNEPDSQGLTASQRFIWEARNN